MNRTGRMHVPRRWWQGLAARERTLVAAGFVVVAIVLVYVVLWEPAGLGIRKLTADLPRLREQNASMHAMADEATRLRTAVGNTAPITTAERPAAVRRSLERAGFWSATNPAARADASSNASSSNGGGTRTVRTLMVGGPVTTVLATAATRAAPPEVIVDGDRVRVRFDDIDYGVWAGWLASAEGELAARATRVSVVSNAPKSPVGHVKAEAVLDWTQASSSASPRP